jgi:hypothetical protein
VQHYRVYLIDGDGHIKSAVDLQCEDDNQALAEAKQVAKGCAVELWQGGRRIAAIEDQPE